MKQSYLRTLLLAFWTILVLFLILWSIIPHKYKEELSNEIESGPIKIPSDVPSTKNILADTPQEQSFRGAKLQTGHGNYWNTIYDNLEHRNFIFTDNLFIVGTNNYGPRVQVAALDLNSGKETLLYSELTQSLYINQIIKINNTLFFSTGGYLAQGGIYYIDFPFENNKVEKITSSRNGSIKQVEGRYWVLGGDGDACVSFGSYSLFDPSLKKIIPIANDGDNCGTGNSLQILPDRVLSFHYIAESNLSTSTYTHVTFIDLNDPSYTERDLISKNEMPKNIYRIEYNKESNSLFLSGSQKYVYNLTTNSLTQKDFVYNKQKIYPDYWKEFTPEEKKEVLKSIPLPKEYRIIFED